MMNRHWRDINIHVYTESDRSPFIPVSWLGKIYVCPSSPGWSICSCTLFLRANGSGWTERSKMAEKREDGEGEKCNIHWARFLLTNDQVKVAASRDFFGERTTFTPRDGQVSDEAWLLFTHTFDVFLGNIEGVKKINDLWTNWPLVQKEPSKGEKKSDGQMETSPLMIHFRWRKFVFWTKNLLTKQFHHLPLSFFHFVFQLKPSSKLLWCDH